ncbi:MAG: glycosyltransferase, partial [Gammaproteobacteria bacterium]|nr:glycosyltransferase [Gammaproteobacteria bacterium]
MDISVVIPTLNREQVLLDTIGHLMNQTHKPREILVVDQTPQHESATNRTLEEWTQSGLITWIRLSRPSIPAAMNAGLLASQCAIVLFIDDDVIPEPDLL